MHPTQVSADLQSCYQYRKHSQNEIVHLYFEFSQSKVNGHLVKNCGKFMIIIAGKILNIIVLVHGGGSETAFEISRTKHCIDKQSVRFFGRAVDQLHVTTSCHNFMSQLHVTVVGKWHLEHGFDVVNTFQRRVTTLCCR